MSKRQIVLTVGIILLILPFLGLPNFWDKVIYFILAVVLIASAYKKKSKTVYNQSSSNGETPVENISSSNQEENIYAENDSSSKSKE